MIEALLLSITATVMATCVGEVAIWGILI